MRHGSPRSSTGRHHRLVSLSESSPVRKWRVGDKSSLWTTWRKRPLSLCLILAVIVYAAFVVRERFFTAEKIWPAPFQFGGPPTLVYRSKDLRRIWEWEVAAGHYPSSRQIPDIGLTGPLSNLARPSQAPNANSQLSTADTVGIGSDRAYYIPQNNLTSYPPRPMEGSITDMDVVMKHCDYSAGKYVRDCLKILRLGAGLDVRPRKSSPSVSGDVRYIYTEGARGDIPQSDDNVQDQGDKGLDGLMSRWGKHYEPHLQLPDPHGYFSQNRPYTSCGDERPIFHMFWKGAFTDKPYMALLSFLYTQNLGLHLDDEKEHTDAAKCRPQLWLWIDRGALNGVRQSMAERQLLEELSSNPWAAPFLHYRFRNVFQFKLWDLREQLDSVAELKDEWRIYGKYLGAREEVGTTGEDTNGPGTQTEPTLGSLHDTSYLIARTSHAARASVQYDKPSVALSDLVRFVLCHRFGGVYLDVDTLFLRDWEDLWGWRGAFAYRWSRMDRYNTAVLRMHKGSAFGTFILRTALRNGLDFHPIRITRYLKDAQMENLLLRVPDALFDPAWLASEGYQTERPPFPFFSSFNDFFDTPSQASAAPEALGFDGFFRGAYIYHYHNNWWTPFDPHRDFPDLGPRFAQDVKTSSAPQEEISDLSWSAVLKRTFEGYIRGEQPNMYGEWLVW